MNSSKYVFNNMESIVLGDYLDLLLNMENPRGSLFKESQEKSETKFQKYENLIYASSSLEVKYSPAETDIVYDGGIRMPKKYDITDKKTYQDDDGSGNIVIIGEPGVGKSTLAFQIAAECTSELNNGIAIYYSIDISRNQLVKSMCADSNDTSESQLVKGMCGENEVHKYASYVRRMDSFQDRNANDSDTALRESLKAALGIDQGIIQPQILLPMLSPRGISQDAQRAHELFCDRFTELEMMLRAVRAYNNEIAGKIKSTIENCNPMIKLVVIDSINMLGETSLTREQISRVFELFEHYGVIGLFTLGENTAQTDAEAVNSATIKYIADVVLQLKREEHNNYTCMTMMVVKSRYIKPLIGSHPYKIVEHDRTRFVKTSPFSK